MPKKHSIDFIREQFRSHGYTLISNEYRGMRYSLEYRCDKHPESISRMSYGNLNAGVRCKYCKAEERRHSIEDVKHILLENGCELVSEEYFGNAKPLDYRCLSHPGEVQTSTLNNIQQRQGCPKCRADKISQVLRVCESDLVRSEVKRNRNRREYKYWRLAVLERDGNTCQCCGIAEKDLESHHIESFAKYKEKRYDIANGITLCRACHNTRVPGSFHNIYGTRNNDINQLNEYLQSKGAYLKGAFSIDKTLKGVLDKWREA